MSTFNDLNSAQEERLAILLEEMGEALQIVGKVLRHGYESHNPYDPKMRSNRELLEKELGDVRFAMIQLCEHADLSKGMIHAYAEDKKRTVEQYLHHTTVKDSS